MSKGFAYTTFAIVAAGLITMIITTQVVNPYETGQSDRDRIGEASFFLESAVDDADRTLEMATRRAFTGTTNYVITEGEPLVNAEENISEVLVNGSMDGENIEGTENASINDWNERVSEIAEASGYSMEIELENYSFNDRGMTVQSNFAVSVTLDDSVTLASFNRTDSTSTETSIEGVEDPLIALRSQGRYISQYTDCGFEKPAEKIAEGEQNSPGYVKGVVTKELDEENREGKIFVTEDVDDYETEELEDYQGIVSEEVSSQPESYNDNYIYGTDETRVEQGDVLILDEDRVWVSRFTEMFEEGCYVETETGPTSIDRLEDSLTSEEGETGLATFLDLSELPEELRRQDSAVDYVYFNSTDYYGELSDIKGVSDEHSWFRLDDYHVEYWGLEDLTG